MRNIFKFFIIKFLILSNFIVSSSLLIATDVVEVEPGVYAGSAKTKAGETIYFGMERLDDANREHWETYVNLVKKMTDEPYGLVTKSVRLLKKNQREKAVELFERQKADFGMNIDQYNQYLDMLESKISMGLKLDALEAIASGIAGFSLPVDVNYAYVVYASDQEVKGRFPFPGVNRQLSKVTGKLQGFTIKTPISSDGKRLESVRTSGPVTKEVKPIYMYVNGKKIAYEHINGKLTPIQPSNPLPVDPADSGTIQSQGFGNIEKFNDDYAHLIMCYRSLVYPFKRSYNNRGIFRNPKWILNGGYQNISLQLHGFSAAVVEKFFPAKIYMNVNALPSMAAILERNLQADDAFIGEKITAEQKKFITEEIGLLDIPFLIKIPALAKFYKE